MRGRKGVSEQTVLVAGLSALIDVHRPGFEVYPGQPRPSKNGSPGYIGVYERSGCRWMAVMIREDDAAGAADALNAGASAIVSALSSNAELLAALDALSAGRTPYITKAIAKRLASGQRAEHETAEPPSPPRLTRRESEVLELLARGYSNREIAEALVISVNTVRSHVHTLAAKLHGSSRSRIVANAIAAGLPEARTLFSLRQQKEHDAARPAAPERDDISA